MGKVKNVIAAAALVALTSAGTTSVIRNLNTPSVYDTVGGKHADAYYVNLPEYTMVNYFLMPWQLNTHPLMFLPNGDIIGLQYSAEFPQLEKRADGSCTSSSIKREEVSFYAYDSKLRLPLRVYYGPPVEGIPISTTPTIPSHLDPLFESDGLCRVLGMENNE